MFRFTQRFGRDRQARWRGTEPMTRVGRPNHRLNREALEGRQLLSGYYIVNASSGAGCRRRGHVPDAGRHRPAR
jgi:hypothetical protein